MPTYRYTAKDVFGFSVTGTYEAASEKEVQIYLRRNGLTPITIKRSWLHSDIQFGEGRIKMKDLIVFTRMFAALARAAVPLDQALNVLHEQTTNRAFRRAIQRIIVDVESGVALSETMRNQSSIFDSLYVNMIVAGERSGNLDLMLERLADLLERTDAVRRKIKGAMVYPAVVITVAAIVVGVMVTFVVPTFVNMFVDSGVPIPFLTQLVIDVSNYVRAKWGLILTVVAGTIIALRHLIRRESVAQGLDRILLRTKVIGPIIQKGAIARTTRTLSTLLHSGIGILDGLELASETAGNVVIRDAMLNARTAIAGGSDVAEPLRQSGVFPPLVTSMVAIGQQAGELEEMLAKVADFYEDDVNRAIDGAVRLVEPMLLVVLGVIVGGILASLYLPLFDMIANMGEAS